MKTFLVVKSAAWTLLLAGVTLAPSAAPLTVHEWGTFTTVSGSDGKLLPGLEREEQPLPPFVHSHAGFSPANKGWNRSVTNVTVKMETPVIYFYSEVSQTVDVDVRFEGGSISQWFPERLTGEKVLPVPEFVGSALNRIIPPIDFAKRYQGSAMWRVEVLAPGAAEESSMRRQWETPAMLTAFPSIEHWQRARVAGANKIRGAKGGVEGFIFYRGVGNFPLPLKITAANDRLSLTNTGNDAIPFLFIYEKNAAHPLGVVRWSGALSAGGCEKVPLKDVERDGVNTMLSRTLPAALQRAGLTGEEAQAMIATWRESYFERSGLRVFWIVPRTFTDRVLPIAISPQPDKMERVLVGRSEVLTPAFEQELSRDFRASDGERWSADRYYLAYRARAAELGVVFSEGRR